MTGINGTIGFQSSIDDFMKGVAEVFAAVSKVVETETGLGEIRKERSRQDEKWGEQNHPARAGRPAQEETAAGYHRLAERAKKANAAWAQDGTLGWDGILLEEAFEAFAELDPDKHEAELIQVAAVALAAWESSRRQRGARTGGQSSVADYFDKLRS